jgi:hypothetical protein
VRLGHFCLKPVSSLIIEHFLWECSLFFFENQEAVPLRVVVALFADAVTFEPLTEKPVPETVGVQFTFSWVDVSIPFITFFRYDVTVTVLLSPPATKLSEVGVTEK